MKLFMARIFIFGALLLTISVFLALAGCEKEKIVESTEYIHEIEYIEVPADTVFQVDTVLQIDTVYNADSVTITNTDTIMIFDTVIQVDYVYDTVLVHDTVTTVQYIYDTTFVTDTVMVSQSSPNPLLAFGALQYHTDPLVIGVVTQDLGYTDGWIFYLSAYQAGWNFESESIYDIYGFIDYWSPDWNDFLALEFYWRMTYISGDPSDPTNWEISDPPGMSAGHQPGLNVIEDPNERSATSLK
jgi:hypothetical protein